MYGCQLRDNGTSSGLYHFSVNGEYSLSMDMDSPQWHSYLPQDLDIKNILDRFELWNHNNLIYIHRDCVPRLKKFYKHSRTILDQQGKCVCLNVSSVVHMYSGIQQGYIHVAKPVLTRTCCAQLIVFLVYLADWVCFVCAYSSPWSCDQAPAHWCSQLCGDRVLPQRYHCGVDSWWTGSLRWDINRPSAKSWPNIPDSDDNFVIWHYTQLLLSNKAQQSSRTDGPYMG